MRLRAIKSSINRFPEIRCPIDKVEEVLVELKGNFVDNLKEETITVKMWEEVNQAVNWRFDAIENTLEFSDEETKRIGELILAANSNLAPRCTYTNNVK